MVKTTMRNPMRILVTGATGFIGSNFVLSLVENGYSVAILKRKESDLKNLISVENRITMYNSDSYNDIYTGIKCFNPDVIVHMAALVIYQHRPDDILSIINSNITLGAYVLEAMKENGAHKFLNIGTRWQHIGNKRYCPANLYAATKEAFKDILIYYETRGITHKTVELSDTFGFGDLRKKVFNILITACQNNEPVDLSPGEQKLDLLCVADICRFIISNIHSNTFFDNKTISLSGAVYKLRDLGTMIEQKFNKYDLFKWGARPYRENEVMTQPLYYRKIQLNQHSLEKYIEHIAFENNKKEEDK